MEILVFNVPHIFFIASTDIKGGEELLVSYGSEFWKRFEHLKLALDELKKSSKFFVEKNEQAERQRREFEKRHAELLEEETILREKQLDLENQQLLLQHQQNEDQYGMDARLCLSVCLSVCMYLSMYVMWVCMYAGIVRWLHAYTDM